jgi:hypothetical protein
MFSQNVNTVTVTTITSNQYRVEAVKEMISNSEYQNYNLLTMGLSPVLSKPLFTKL